MNNSENSILLQTPTTVVLCIEREGNNAEKKKKKLQAKCGLALLLTPLTGIFLF